MLKLKWSTTFQILIIILGLTGGVFFSRKAMNMHGKSHIDQTSHSLMDHGYIDISYDSIIPELEKVEIFKDQMSGWNLHLETKKFKFTPENASSKHVPGCGHAHLMINGNKVARIYSNWYHIPQLDSPIEELEITLNSNSHSIMIVNEKPISIKLIDID